VKSFWLAMSCVLLFPAFGRAADSLPPLDGRGIPVHDALLDSLAGRWHISRTMRSRTEENTLTAEWVLQHQFLRLHYEDVKRPPQYETMCYLGYDNASERYVLHWIDVFGGRFSETVGYGTRDGNSIKFVFEYPDGPFTNTYAFDPATRSWTSLMRQKDPAGKWTTFAEDRITRLAE